MSVGQIAQLIVPADGLGNISFIVPDYARGRLYGLGVHSGSPSGGNLRSYNLSLVTQSPILSVETNGWGQSTNMVGSAPVDVDPVTGNIIGQWFGTNIYMPVSKIDPVSLTRTAVYGISSNFTNYPTGIQFAEQVICVACGTLANPNALVGYALTKDTIFSGNVAALRVSDTFTHAGFYQPVVSGSTNNRGLFCRGESGPSGGSIYGSWANTIPTPTIPLYKVSIAPGAELYNPASWPTTNPYITKATIGLIAAASVDPTWTNVGCAGIGYDRSDGNVLMICVTNDTVTTRRYLVKLNAATAAVMWASPIGAPGYISNLNFGNYTGGIAPLYDTNTDFKTFDTSDGSSSSLVIGGLTLAGSGFLWDFADTVSGLHVWQGTYNQAASPNSPAPVDGTPTAFSGIALILGFFTPPVVTSATELGDLWFSPTSGFVDFRVTANRRLFVGDDGSTSWPGDNGEEPTGTIPPLFLHLSPSDGTAADFALNAGSGGTFTIAGGSLALVGSWPACGVYLIPAPTVNEPQGADPIIMLSVSDDGGRTFSSLQKWRSLGKEGEYLKRLRWLKMGMFRQRQIRLEITDPVRRNIVGIYQDVSEGLDM
jgi:hypothetical protein